MHVAPCTAEQTTYRGRPALRLQNGLITLVASLDSGGRLVALDLDGHPFLADAPITPGDGAPATVAQLTATAAAASVTFQVAPDAQPGLRIARRLSILQGASRARVDVTYTNVGSQPGRWSIADAVPLRATRGQTWLTAPQNPHSRQVDGYSVLEGEADHAQWGVDERHGLVVGHYLGQSGYVGIDPATGWATVSDMGSSGVLAVHFDAFPDAQYPSTGAPIEVWTTPDHLTLSARSPLFTVAAGASRAFSVDWAVCCARGMALEIAPGGCVVEPLRAERDADGERVRGRFGVFHVGVLKLIGHNAAGRVIAAVDLGPVSPLAAIAVDHAVSLPPQVTTLELAVVDGQGHTRPIACSWLVRPAEEMVSAM